MRLSASEERVVANVIADAYASDLDPTAVCVLVRLAAAAQRAGRLDLAINTARLAEGCGITAPQARRAVGALRRAGWLRRPTRELGQRRTGPRRLLLSTPATSTPAGTP